MRIHILVLAVLTTFIPVLACNGSEPNTPLRTSRAAVIDTEARWSAQALALGRDHLLATQPERFTDIVDLRAERVQSDRLGLTHWRFAQTVDDIPVFGAQVIVHLDRHGTVRGISDHWVGDIAVDTRAELRAWQATELAVAAAGGWSRTTGLPDTDMQILRHEGTDHLTYRVRIAQFEPGDQPRIAVIFVDAKSGDIVWSYDDLQTISLSDSSKATYDMASATNYSTANIADSSDPIASSAHTNIGHTLDYFLAVHGLDSFDGNGSKVLSYVHYGQDYSGAFWNGNTLTFGDGDGVTSGAMVSLDIVAHEFAHGVTDFSADLIYANESGALNEATSDIFAAAVEHAQGGSYTDIWYVGEDVWLADTALRYMDDPARAAYNTDYYPDRYAGSADNGGVHWNSGIGSLFFYLLSEGGSHPRGKTSNNVTAIGITDAAHIWYRALTAYMVPSTDFAEARLATIAAASDLFGAGSAQVTSVQAAWDAVGVSPPPTYQVIDTQTGLSGATGSLHNLDAQSASGYSAIKFALSGGMGDADLYVRFGAAPTTVLYDCRPYRNGNDETCEFESAQPGDYHVMVRGHSSYSDVTLTVSAVSQTASWIEIDSTNFESGWDGYLDGGSDCFLNNNALYANSGLYSARIRDNSNAASAFSRSFDLGGYSELEIGFSFYPVSMENGEDFFVELNTGSGWVAIANYTSGSDFANDVRYSKTVTYSGGLSSDTQIRFRADASSNADRVYIDDVVLRVR
ncbi:MAG: M4 family metallopeptidase [Myxococcota bacterium]